MEDFLAAIGNHWAASLFLGVVLICVLGEVAAILSALRGK